MEIIMESDENPDRSSKKENRDDDYSIQEYMGFVKKCMKSMAMLPMFESHKLKYFNVFYMCLVDLISIKIFLFSTIDLIYSWDGNLNKATMNMINTIIYFTNTLLLLYFQIFEKKSMYLMNFINSSFKYKSAEGLTRLNMKASFEKARKYSVFFTVACLVGTIHYAIQPLVIERHKRMLPIKLWYPVDVKQSPYYELAYCSQIFGQIMIALVYSNFGVFFLSLCVLVCGQFDILCCSLRNLVYTVLIMRRFRTGDLVQLSGYNYTGINRCTLPDDERKTYFSGESEIMDPKLDKIYRDDPTCIDEYFVNSKANEMLRFEFEDDSMIAVKDCLKHHEMILEFCCTFDEFCGPISFVKMLEITLLICLIMYAFSVSFQIPILEYGVLSCVDLFLLCYFGNEVKLRSYNIKSAIFGGPWQLLGARPLRYVLPLLIRSGRPVHLRGGKFYSLTLENYIAVLKVSMSYFTVLRRMNEKVEIE